MMQAASDSAAAAENGKTEDSTASPNTVRRGRHLEMLIICSLAIVASFLLTVEGGETVQLKWLSFIPVPKTCLSRELFGLQCPGCGLTRSFVHLAHMDLFASVSMHRLGWLLFICTLAQIPYRIHALRNNNQTLLPVSIAKGIGSAIIFLLVLNWLVGLLPALGLQGN